MYEKGTLCLREILNIDGINITKFDFTISSHEAFKVRCHQSTIYDYVHSKVLKTHPSRKHQQLIPQYFHLTLQ